MPVLPMRGMDYRARAVVISAKRYKRRETMHSLCLSHALTCQTQEHLTSQGFSALQSLPSHEVTKMSTLQTAFGPETYVRVRWQWTIAPCFIVVASVAFLLFTIFESKDKEQQFKSSVLAGYFNGLSGYSEADFGFTEDPFREKDSYHNLLKKARYASVRLCRDERGRLVFVKEET